MSSDQRVIRLYDGPAPGSESWTHQQQAICNEQGEMTHIFNVVDPTLTLFVPDPDQANGTALIICPGGGMHYLAAEEGSAVARRLMAEGVTCFVFNYRLVECKTSDPSGEWGAKAGQNFRPRSSQKSIWPSLMVKPRLNMSAARQSSMLSIPVGSA